MIASIIIVSHKRNELLQYQLISLKRTVPAKLYQEIEVIICDEYFEPDQTCQTLCKTYNATYLHTGITKKGVDVWRVPGYAFNYAIDLVKSPMVFLACAEMYHIMDNITPMLKAHQYQMLTICRGYDDQEKMVLENARSVLQAS